MNHNGLKKRWKYQVITRLKKAHRKKKWRFAKSEGYFKKYHYFASMLNRLWKITWYAYIGASLLDPRFSVQYIGRLIRHIPEKNFPMIRYCGLFCNRWKKQFMADARIALNQPETKDSDAGGISSPSPTPEWAERQTEYRGINPFYCPICQQELRFVGKFFGSWRELQQIFDTAGKDSFIPAALLKPG